LNLELEMKIKLENIPGDNFAQANGLIALLHSGSSGRSNEIFQLENERPPDGAPE
jgi:hypothetical protein